VPLVADPWFWAFLAAVGWGLCTGLVGSRGLGRSLRLGVSLVLLAEVPRALLPLPFVSQPASRRAAPYQGEAGAELVDQPDGGVDCEQLDRVEDELGGVGHVVQMTKPMTAAPGKESPGGPGARCARACRR
jgi:hypothetical protein